MDTVVADLLTTLRAQVAKNGYTHITIRAGMLKANGIKQFVYGRIDYSNASKKPDDDVQDYGNFELVRKTFDIADSDRIVTALLAGNLDLSTESVSRNDSGGKIKSHFLPSMMAWSHFEFDYPVQIITLPTGGQVEHTELAARKGPPYFATVVNAISSYMDLADKVYNNGLDIILPESRGRIKELVIVGKELSVIADMLRAGSNYVVKFSCRKGKKMNQTSPDLSLVSDTAKFECDFEPDAADVALVDTSSDDMLDTKEFAGLYSPQGGVTVKTPENFVSEMIKAGESKTVEFKVGIQERDEILNTIDSFANSEGGTIIVGVADNKTPRGFFEDLEDSKKMIQGLVKGYCEPTIETKVQLVTLGGKPLLLIRIEEGNDKPYVVREKGIFIRDGDGDYHISRAQLDKIYSSGGARHGTGLKA